MFNIYLEYLYTEAKEAIIKRMPWTDEQKQEVQELVDKYPQKASKINWQDKELKAEDALAILKEESKKDVKKQIRKGVTGLVEGTDYLEFDPPEDAPAGLRIFAPLHHKASCALGRGSKWCTTMENNATHWNSYTNRQGRAFFYIHNPESKNPELRLIAVAVGKRIQPGSGDPINYYDANDKGITQYKVAKETRIPYSWFIEHYENVRSIMREKHTMILRQQKELEARRWQYSNAEELRNIIEYMQNNDYLGIGNYTINSNLEVVIEGGITFGPIVKKFRKLPFKIASVAGPMYCNGVGLSSWEGFPSKVTGDLIVSRNNFKTLEGCPKYIGGDFNINFNKLTTLSNGPEVVEGKTYISQNPLTKETLENLDRKKLFKNEFFSHNKQA